MELEGLEYLDSDDAMIEAHFGRVRPKIEKASEAFQKRNRQMNEDTRFWVD